MFQTAFTLTMAQFARSLSLPERLQRTPSRNLALEALRQRNTALDALFYDVKVITPEEAFYISDSLAAQGSIMIVPPTGQGSLTLCDTFEEFVLRGGRDVHALAIAGIGGSALGAAAFARNVADAANAPVAVVVSGYGLADIVTEAFGGHFFFGHLRGLRPTFEALDDLAGRPKFGAAEKTETEHPSRVCLDTRTVRALLGDARLSFNLLVGHSKGNLVLSAALHDLVKSDTSRADLLARHIKIVTFGSRIAMPLVFTDVVDVMGAWDWFGEINSRSFIPADRYISNAGHHTNTDLPNHMPVTDTLREILQTATRIEESPAASDRNVAARPDIAPASPARKTGSRSAKKPPSKEAIANVAAQEAAAREQPTEHSKPH
ncbi:hypothetical protein [Rhizobium sp. BK376]|uniref:hypothetical protein n=1 Tax=Rhizobium sp. BK376 TaxID=2512149 RepID=UPI0010DC3B48|nr:hypothetical protein [Rhizobium sp. BK376]TCR92156.1 hypothetical protein EV561_102601 [Rhizobium sp. BK376]